MSSSFRIGDERTDDTLGDRFAPKQSFWHRRDRRVRMLDGEIVMRKATLTVIGGTLVALVFFVGMTDLAVLMAIGVCVTDVAVVMTIGVVVVSVRRPRALTVMARVMWQSFVVMRLWPMMVCAERLMKRDVNRRQHLDAAEPNQACEHGCPPDGRSGASQASGAHVLASGRCGTSHR